MIPAPSDPDRQIDRLAASGRISAEDAHALHDFTAFLADPSTRCPICLQETHTSPWNCPEVSEADRAAARAKVKTGLPDEVRPA